ncbi:hypothetical protein [Microbacterium rhizomatis]|uniref:DUF7882 domain-containing protein n=1 Tax=Microbacterium rhizomatis TaxID=1631477 RepID=A0A5J5J3C1_9MICO|nr:hypothetical protein [Microbacterium rhizomatis]KAA9107708.1 hypothetical protein F6B43_09675 [Microbacterium rhizomatis]
MGTIYYGDDTDAIDLPDRLLTHLQAVVITKFRRGESFTLTWAHSPSEDGDRTTVWLQPSMALRFEFDGAVAEPLDPAFLRDLVKAANSPSGVSVGAGAGEASPPSAAGSPSS